MKTEEEFIKNINNVEFDDEGDPLYSYDQLLIALDAYAVQEIKKRIQLIYIELARIIIIIALIIFTIWYIKQGIEQGQANKVESFIEHSEIKK